MVPLQACAGWAETVNCHAHPRILLPQNRCLSEPLAAPFPRQPEPRCNTLDFASKVVCQRGAAVPLETQEKRPSTVLLVLGQCASRMHFTVMGLSSVLSLLWNWRGSPSRSIWKIKAVQRPSLPRALCRKRVLPLVPLRTWTHGIRSLPPATSLPTAAMKDCRNRHFCDQAALQSLKFTV